MKKPAKNEIAYRNPKIHSDLMRLFCKFFAVHRSMNKYLRIVILESEILDRIAEAMRLTIEINAYKAAANTAYVYERTNVLRAHLENIKAFALMLWDMRAISEGFYVIVTADLELISKQVAGWQRHLLTRKPEEAPATL